MGWADSIPVNAARLAGFVDVTFVLFSFSWPLLYLGSVVLAAFPHCPGTETGEPVFEGDRRFGIGR